MSSFAKISVAVTLVFFACCAVSPLSHAQSGSLPNILQVNTPGSYLGVQMEDVTAANMSKFKITSERGVIVQSVVKGSPAEEAGLHDEDVILEYGGFQVWSAQHFSRLVEETPPGRKVDLAVSRDGKRITMTAKIATRSGRTMVGRAEMPPGNRTDRDLLDRLFVLPRPDQRDNAPGEPAGKPRLGVTLLPLSEQHAESLGVPGKKGVLVSSVSEGSPSAGKLHAGDVIISADGKETREPEQLTRIVREKSEGILALKVVRDKKQISIDVNMPALPGGEGRGLKL
jgi:serine protease Do